MDSCSSDNSMDVDDILKAIVNLINTRQKQITYFNKMIKLLRGQEIACSTVSTVASSGTILSAILLFTPLAPIGAIGLATSGVVAVGNGLGDSITSMVRQDLLSDELEKARPVETAYQEIMTKLRDLVVKMMEKKGMSEEKALLYILHKKMPNPSQAHSMINPEREFRVRLGSYLEAAMDVAEGVVSIISGVAEIIAILKVGSDAAAKGLGAASKALGAVAAVLSVADIVLTWTQGNPCLQDARDLEEKLEKEYKRLDKQRKAFSELTEKFEQQYWAKNHAGS